MKIISVKIVPRVLGAALASSVLLLTAACGQSTGPGATTQPGQLNVVAAFYPFQFVAERVAGDHAVVTSLTAPGAEPHDLELTPKQVASVSDADLVVYEKSFQAAVDEAVAQSGNSDVLDTATVVPLAPFEDGAEDHAGHDHSTDDHSTDDHSTEGSSSGGSSTAASGEDDHDHGGLDPHVWLDPKNMVTITQAVADRLSAKDPAHAADYKANAATLVGQLQDLEKAYSAGLKTCTNREFITTHAAFGYLAREYDLEQVGINGLSPDSEPSPARIAEVQQIAREHKVTTIFYETLVSPAVATSIAADLGLKTDVLDPIEGITDKSKGSDYLAVMTSNLTALQKANGCS